MSDKAIKVRYAESCIKILEIFWLLFIIPAYSKFLEDDLNAKDSSQVKVRAVFINCEINETQMPYGTDTLRFQREELFKHSALRNCKMKLALTVKIFSDSSQPLDDEYIPIEHVFESSNRKRVRLLNPYILRLRREPLYETYKLHEIDSFSGLLTASKDKLSRLNIKEIKNSKKRHTELDFDRSTVGDESGLISTQGNLEEPFPIKKDATSMKMESTSDQIESTDNNRLSSTKYEETEKINNLQSPPVVINDNTKTMRNSNRKAEALEHKLNYQSSHNVRSILPDKVSQNTNFLHPIDHIEKEFILYEIGNPKIWFRAHVQLLEKLSTSEGKTIWRDLTEKNSAWVSSNSNEWRNQDLSIRYRCDEWIPREDFTVPSNGFGLLLPRDGKIINEYNDVDFVKFVIVPYDDIETEKNQEHIKREDNSSFNVSSTSERSHRRALIRLSRALFGGSDENYMFINEGADKYLKITYKQPYHAQIDVEAKADENQLVYVGSSARLATAVSESTRRSRTTLTVQATNTGLAAARFRPKIHECSPEITRRINDYEMGQASDPVLIPPMQSSTFRFELPIEGSGDVSQCSVALLNDADESVAVRNVRIKRGDRCFCVWHCECVCLSEDPKLHCQEMAEYQQLVAGLSPRKRLRQVRAACYPDVVSINLIVVIIGVIFILLALGFIKACLGLLCRGIGSWGIDQLIQTPRKLDHYYERSLRSRGVEFDADGWPIHPDTKKRSVRLISKSMEFALNTIFFITLPCLALRHSFKIIFTHFQNKEVDKSFHAKDNGRTQHKVSSHNMEGKKDRCRSRSRNKRLERWMTPQAEELSTDIWRNGLAPQGLTRPKSQKRPLLKDEQYPCKPCMLQNLAVDSECDDTEYVLLQMRKSKESLAKSQCTWKGQNK